jgi:hypothetical protein
MHSSTSVDQPSDRKTYDSAYTHISPASVFHGAIAYPERLRMHKTPAMRILHLYYSSDSQ